MSKKDSPDSVAAVLGLIAFLFMFGMVGYLAVHVSAGIYAKIEKRLEPHK